MELCLFGAAIILGFVLGSLWEMDRELKFLRQSRRPVKILNRNSLDLVWEVVHADKP